MATVVVLGYGGWLASNGDVSIGTLVAFLGYLTNFFDPVQQLSQLYNTFLSAVAALDKITDLLDEEPEVSDRPDAVDLPSIRGDVSFEAVRFAYGRGPEVLHGIDLDVAAGTTVALVGHTGAGKSTIAKLIARFYDPTDGRITIDGVDLRDVSQASLRRQLGIVPQEGFLFAGSVADNIAFGRPGASLEEIVAATRAVGADDFISRLEHGYDTELGERGSRLSLGQRQLVAFSRALLADPRILILDEATSSVDIGTERKIERALRRLLHGRTAFIIAHRLSTIRDADLIVVLEHGVVRRAGDARRAARGRRPLPVALQRLGRSAPNARDTRGPTRPPCRARSACADPRASRGSRAGTRARRRSRRARARAHARSRSADRAVADVDDADRERGVTRRLTGAPVEVGEVGE